MHTCVRAGEVVTFREAPMPSNPAFVALIGLCRRKRAASLLLARDALVEHGALDEAMFKTRGRGA